jgi:hypothetical protein
MVEWCSYLYNGLTDSCCIYIYMPQAPLPLTFECGSAGQDGASQRDGGQQGWTWGAPSRWLPSQDSSHPHRQIARLLNMQAPGAYNNNPVAPPPPAAPKKYDGQNGVPLYDASHGGHYGASAAIATAGHAPPPETFSGHWGNVSTHLRAHNFTSPLIY